MTKKIILTIFSTWVILPIFAQTFKKFSLSGEAFIGNTYTVIRKDSTNNPMKFLNAKQWLSRVFPSYKDIVQIEDEAHGKIVLKGKLPVAYNMDKSNVNITYHPTIDFLLTIDIKPEKYRLKLDDLVVTVIRKERTPLGDRVSQAICPISEYVSKFIKHDVERMDLSASITEFLNTAIDTVEIVDVF